MVNCFFAATAVSDFGCWQASGTTQGYFGMVVPLRVSNTITPTLMAHACYDIT